MSPVLALAGLAAIGLLVTRLPRPPWRRVPGIDLLLVAGGPLVLLGLVLGPGIAFIDRPTLIALAPLAALATGWIGATLGARFEWRYVRRIPRGAWLLAAASAAAAFAVVALGAWLLARTVPTLSEAWGPSRLPALLTLAAVAAASGPGAVALAARFAGIRRSVTRACVRAAFLETAFGALAATVPLALHGGHRLGWIVLAAGSGALVALVFLALTRLQPEPADLGFTLLATLLFGAGVGYAADVSPFVVCALATVLIVTAARRRQAVRRVLADWERPIYAVFLVMVGALLTLPTAWILVAAPLLAGARAAAKWAAVRNGRVALKLAASPPDVGLATIAQGGAALALGLNFSLMYGGLGEGGGSSGAVLTTIVLAVAVALLSAPRLMAHALRAGPVPLTRAAAGHELSANAPAELPR